MKLNQDATRRRPGFFFAVFAVFVVLGEKPALKKISRQAAKNHKDRKVFADDGRT